MANQSKLLSIGEMSALTGASIQALRYYERKNLLKPAYVDPGSGYRYYSFEQANCVELISSCVELGIPLKELTALFDTDDFELIRNFFVKNKEAAEKKLKLINIGLKISEKALKKMELNRLYNLEQIYMREIPRKTYYVKPCGPSMENINRIEWLIELSKELQGMLNIDCIERMIEFPEELKDKLNYDGIDEQMVLMEYGFLCERSPDGIQYYIFAELPEGLAIENIMTVPSGAYCFRQDRCSKIEDAPRIFEQHLKGQEHFLVIEVEEMLSGKSKIYDPIYEMRLVAGEQGLHRLTKVFCRIVEKHIMALG